MAAMVAEPVEAGADIAADVVVDTNGHAEEAQAAPEAAKLYFVRMPRPPMDDTKLKKLQAEFQAHIADIKAINTRLAAKRDVVRQLRNQMAEARSLKGSSQPEFEEKVLKQLRDQRKSIQDKISEIKAMVSGDIRSEAELDARIAEQEEKIRFGTVPLREEKMVINEMSKLRQMRDKIKEFEARKAELPDLESEKTKVKAILAEKDSEFSIMKGERDSVSKVVQEKYTELKNAESEAHKVQEEQEAAVERKNEALEALEAARREMDATMADYRENRKFSLQVRDLIAVGSTADAAELCSKQVDEMMGRLSSDSAFRAEYQQVWADQRRFPVSELLPESSTSGQVAPAKGGAKGGPGVAKEAKERPVARGAEKAKDLIASIMQRAAQRAMGSAVARGTEEDDDDGGASAAPVGADAHGKPGAAAAAAKPAAPAKMVHNPAAKAAEVFGVKVDLPKVDSTKYEFELPKAAIVKDTKEVSREQVRAEQMAKAAEAEERKRKAAEAKVLKAQKAAEAKKKAEEEDRQARAAAEAAAAAAAAEAREAKARKAAEAAAAKAAADATRAAQSRIDVARRPAPSARRPTSSKDQFGKMLAKAESVWEKHPAAIATAVVVLVMFLILMLAR